MKATRSIGALVSVALVLLSFAACSGGQGPHGQDASPDGGVGEAGAFDADAGEESVDASAEADGGRALSVVTLNILHGRFCANGTAYCRLEDRARLLGQLLAADGCPDLVTIQEAWPLAIPLLQNAVASACGPIYEGAWAFDHGEDEQLIFSRWPISNVSRQTLHDGFRSVTHVRVDHPIEPIEVYTTHLSSEGDIGPLPCDNRCPQSCANMGAFTHRDCQAVELGLLAMADPEAVVILTGDMNDLPDSFLHSHLTSAGFVDAYLAGGGLECLRTGDSACTAGRPDDRLSSLEVRANDQNVRIDYVFVMGLSASCRLRASDFADRPNPFAASCGGAPLPVCWPSDHDGLAIELDCD